MTKKLEYKCNSCGATETNKEPKWLEIGSDSQHGLFITNRINHEQGISSLSNHSAIHFCSKHCFVGYFFGDEDAEMFKSAT